MEAAVHTSGLRRVYERGRQDPVVALDDLTLTIEQNEIHGLLGPNGAGKTTLVKILSTVLLPSGGSARILGRDVVTDTRAVRSLVGLVLGGDRGLYDRLSARRNLLFWGALYKLDARTARSRADALLERVGLAERADDRVERFSRGMRQRLHLARGLLHEPRVLLLDEPTSSLDLQRQLELLQLVQTLVVDRSMTVLIALHDLNLAARFVDRLVILHQGRSYAEGVPADVLTEMMLWQVYGVEARVERDADGLPHITPLRPVRDRAGAEREPALAGAMG
jgi:ABC-2 type transport system ATP-binding protein